MTSDRLTASRRRGMTRRRALKTSGAGIAGAVAANGIGGLWARQALAQQALTYAFWPWGQEIVEENARKFEATFNEALNLEPIPGDYLATLETKLAGGAPIDMFRAQRGQASRWHAAGWIQPLNGLPDLEKIKSEMFPNIVESSMRQMATSSGSPIMTVARSSCSETRRCWRRRGSSRRATRVITPRPGRRSPSRLE